MLKTAQSAAVMENIQSVPARAAAIFIFFISFLSKTSVVCPVSRFSSLIIKNLPVYFTSFLFCQFVVRLLFRFPLPHL